MEWVSTSRLHQMLAGATVVLRLGWLDVPTASLTARVTTGWQLGA